MSRSDRKRISKWDLIDEAQSPNERENLPMSFHDGGSDRHSSRISSGTKDAKWSMMDSNDKERLSGGRFSKNDADYSASMAEWEVDGNYSMKRSPRIDEWRKRSRSRSPKGRWSRALRSRSRSRSPSRDYRRESGMSDRNRSKPSAPLCRDFSAGRCRKGDHCQFVHHNNNHNFEDRRYPESNLADGYESRYRNNNDTMEHSLRAGRSDQICNDFLNGRCQRGPSCRYVHDRPSDEFNMGSAEEMIREREDERKIRGSPSEHGGWRGPHKTTAEVPCKFFASGNCRNGDNCKFSHYSRQNSSSGRRSRDDRFGKDDRSDGGDQNRESKWNNTEFVNGSKLSEGEYRRQGVSESRFSPWSKDDERDRNFDQNKTIENDEKEFVQSKTENTESKGTETWLGDMEMSPEWNYRVKSPTQVKKEESSYTNQISVSLSHNEMSYLPAPSVNKIREVSNKLIHDAAVVHPNMCEKTYVQQHPRPNGDAMHAFPFNGQSVYDNSAVQRQQIITLDSSNEENNKYPQNLTPFQDGMSIENRDVVDTSSSQFLSEIPPMQNTTPNEQIAQLTNLSAMLPQIYAALNPPNTMDSIPAISHSNEAASTQPSASFLSPKQYDPILDSIQQIKADVNTHPLLFSQVDGEQKSISNRDHKLGNDLMKQSKQVTNGEDKENYEMAIEENKNLESESKKPRENSPVDNADEGGETDEAKKSKDGKGLKAFKFALVEFVKELLKPSWKEGQINKEAYKTIVKKVVDKVTGTIQGTHVPQTQEKIDQYLSVSKAKLTKLVQAYVEKHQKAEKK